MRSSRTPPDYYQYLSTLFEYNGFGFVYEASFRPTDLTIHLHVALECDCVLSRISTMRDEVIGYKSPVIEVTDEGKTTEYPVVVVSFCERGKVP